MQVANLVSTDNIFPHDKYEKYSITWWKHKSLDNDNDNEC